MNTKNYLEKLNKEINANEDFIEEVCKYFDFTVSGDSILFNDEEVVVFRKGNGEYLPKAYVLTSINVFIKNYENSLYLERSRLKTLTEEGTDSVKEFINSKKTLESESIWNLDVVISGQYPFQYNPILMPTYNPYTAQNIPKQNPTYTPTPYHSCNCDGNCKE